jgi:integrase
VNFKLRCVVLTGKDMKNGKPLVIPLSKGALDVLHAQEGTHDEFVFTYRGRTIQAVKTAFIAACTRAGVGHQTDRGYVGFTWHGLRHTWATWHIQNGTPLDVLQKLGGWSDLRMVMNYAHHSTDYLAQYADNARKTT